MKKSESSVEQQPLSSKAQQLTKGLGKFVSQIINMYKSGFNSRRLLLQQSLAKVAAPPPPSSAPPPPPLSPAVSAGLDQGDDYQQYGSFFALKTAAGGCLCAGFVQYTVLVLNKQQGKERTQKKAFLLELTSSHSVLVQVCCHNLSCSPHCQLDVLCAATVLYTYLLIHLTRHPHCCPAIVLQATPDVLATYSSLLFSHLLTVTM